MIEYSLRLVFCSAFFIGIYYGILQNERMYSFNRFYLILTAIASVLIPILNFEGANTAVLVVDKIIANGSQYFDSTITSVEVQKVSSISYTKVAVFLYVLISTILTARLLVFNRIILKKAKQGRQIKKLTNAILVLTNYNHPPHSYLNYIFISKSAYENGAVDEKIIDHELAHVVQRHTIDVLFIELLMILFWFNPVFYFFRNAIRLNHEFLADEAVIEKHKNKLGYQQLLINNTALINEYNFKRTLSCPFNYLKTKKRLKMMSKMKITRRIVLKQCLFIPIILIAMVLFSNNAIAQDVKDFVAKNQTLQTQDHTSTEQELQNEFDDLLKPFIKEKNGRIGYYGIGKEAQQKLIPVYEKMSEAQKTKQIVRYWPGLQKRNPSKEEFESWKNSSQCGVWLDENRIANEELNQLEYTDIAHYSKSRLTKTAKNYGKHIYQVNARTNANFKAYNDRVRAEPYLVFWPQKKQ